MKRYASRRRRCNARSRVDDPRLHGHVQRAGRLVEQQEARFEDQGASDGDALALAARELVRVAVHRQRIDADLGQRLGGEPAAFAVVAADAVHPHALLDDPIDVEPRAERRERVLEHRLHFTAQRAQGAALQPRQVAPVEADGPLARHQPQQRQAQRRLAGAGLAHHAHRLPGAERQRDSVHRLDVPDRAAQHAPADREPHPQVRARHRLGRAVVGRRRLGARPRREELPRIGMPGRVEHLGRLPAFDDLALRHHVDPFGYVADDGEVVGYQQDRHPEIALQVGEQPQDLRLDGHVERRRRFVGDQQVGFVGERHGDHHPLALPARQLVRPRAQPPLRLGEADEPEQLEAARARRGGAQALVQRQRFADLPLHRVQRVERRHRLLEHHRDAVAADRAEDRRRRAEQLPPVEPDAPAGVARARIGQELEDRQRGDRLAGAGFADQRRRFAPVHRQRHAAHRLDLPVLEAERDRQPVDFEQGHGALRVRLARVERVAHRLADEHQQREHDGEGEEPGEAQPRRLQVVLALVQQHRRARASPAAGRSPGSPAR